MVYNTAIMAAIAHPGSDPQCDRGPRPGANASFVNVLGGVVVPKRAWRLDGLS